MNFTMIYRYLFALVGLVLVQSIYCTSNQRIREQPLLFFPDRLQNSNQKAFIDKPLRVAGYFQLSRTESAEMFYWFFENRNQSSDAPLAIWFNGGPGCSSSVGLLFEQIGPYIVDQDTLQFSENPNGWDTVFNILFVDQPIGVGFSYSDSPQDRVFNEQQLSEDMLDFIRAFYAQHPNMQSRDLYLTGESYAGKYMPNIAARFLQYNQEADYQAIKLVGMTIGNGLTAPQIQFSTFSNYAKLYNLIDNLAYEQLKSDQSTCVSLIRACQSSNVEDTCAAAQNFCKTATWGKVLEYNPGMNVFDVSKYCPSHVGSGEPGCYNFQFMYDLLNDPVTQRQLGVSRQWVDCSKEIFGDFLGDMMKREDDKVAVLLEQGLHVLVYVGENDMVCNWIGTLKWVGQLEWSGASQWLSSDEHVWVVDGQVGGVRKQHDKLTFLKVFDAGHMVPHDQLRLSTQMMSEFVGRVKSMQKMAYLVRVEY